MRSVCRMLAIAALAGLARPPEAMAQGAAPAIAAEAGANDPVLRLEGDGPLGPVSALAFGPDGSTLYEAGWDKVVRTWARDAATGRFASRPDSTLRIPIGPGDAGVLHALAVSSDGAWLAAAGNAVLPELSGFRQVGLVLPREGAGDPTAQGVIYVFDLRAQPPAGRQLRGHRGPVEALTFAETTEGRPPLLLSAGPEVVEPGKPPRLGLRLWDVAASRELARDASGTFRGLRPWLSAWSDPAEPDRPRAAVAWTDGSSFSWDPLRAAPRPIPDPFQGRSTVLARLPGRSSLLVGHYGRPPTPGPYPEGYLAWWDESSPTAPVRRAVLDWGDHPGASAVKSLPVALALASSRVGGPRDLAAVVVEGRAQPDEPRDGAAFPCRLLLIELAPDRFGAVRARADLWAGPKVQPFAAASPDGDRIAIAGDPRHEILVFSVADLLAGRAAPDRLRARKVGPIGLATFARRGPDWGLMLRTTPKARPGDPIPAPGPDDVVFDFMNRRFADSSAGWRRSVPAPGAWQARLVPPRRDEATGRVRPGKLWIYENRAPVGPGIAFEPEIPTNGPADVRVTDFALLPPGARPGLGVPIVAVARDEPEVGPTLWLHDGRSGERFRQLAGHTGTIRGVAFSDDGRFLVSTADDRTASVWSLTDLDRILSARGALPGLVLAQRDGRYVVAEDRRKPDPTRADLRVGDVVAGFVEGGQVRRPGSVREFYFTAATRKPGERVLLSRSRDGRPAEAVPVALGQAIDERKPMLSLLATPAGPGRPRDWLAWSPIGPYDRGGPAVESLFGWHFNALDQPAEPARFARASEYAQFRREGLLRDLIEAGRFVPPAPPPPLPAPGLSLIVEPDGRPVARGRLHVPGPPTALRLAIDDRLPRDRIKAVAWQLDGDARGAMAEDGPTWTADLSGVAWDRAPHRLTVAVTTDEPIAQTFTTTEEVRYVPGPPRLVPKFPRGIAEAPAAGLDVSEARFPFAADVETSEGEKARARLVVRHDDEVIFQAEYGPDFAARPIDASPMLRAGANTIELTAVNEGAPEDLKAEETARLGPITVNYRPRPVVPPTIALDALSIPPEDPDGPIIRRKIRGTDLGAVASPRVVLEGRVTSKDRLLSVELQYAGCPWKTLAGGPSATLPESYDLRAAIDLVPDRDEPRQAIRIRARSANDADESAARVATLLLEYRPTVPRLGPIALDPPGPIVRPGTGGEPVLVRLTAPLLDATEHHPIDRAEVLVDDEPVAEPATIDARSGALSANVPVGGGTHRIRVRLRNPWSTATGEAVAFEFRRPPSIEPMEARVQPGRPYASITARVASLSPLRRVEVAVTPRSGARRAQLARWERAGDAWSVVAEVPVEPGPNEVAVTCWNDDRPATEERRTLTYEKPPEPRPVVLIETAEQAILHRPASTVRFRVVSASPLSRVSLVRSSPSDPRVVVARFETKDLSRGPDGRYALPVARDVRLEPGPNAFRVEAANAGGEASADLLLSYAPPPVRVEIDGIASRAGAGRLVAPTAHPDGPPSLPEPLDENRATLGGRVVWADADSFRRWADGDARDGRDDLRVQVWVNGFPQVAAALEPVPGRPLERAFRAEVLLSQLRNELDVRLRGAPLDIHGDPRLLVACRKAERGSRLHLWIIGLGVEDEDGLRDRAIAALKGHDFDAQARTFRTPAFPVARLWGPDCKDLSPQRARMSLWRIARETRLTGRASNEVVMIYYQGGEVIRGEEPCLRVGPGADDVLRLGEVQAMLSGTRGAKLFLLDVTHVPAQAPLFLVESARWIKEDSPFGLLRFAWQGRPDLTAGAQPDADLATAFGSALDRAATLKDVDAEVDRSTLALQPRFPTLRYRSELNRHLDGLILGGP